MSTTKRIAVIPGDGIGKEVIPQAVRVMQAAGAAVEMTSFDWGADRFLADQTTVPPDGFAMLARDFDAIRVRIPESATRHRAAVRKGHIA